MNQCPSCGYCPTCGRKNGQLGFGSLFNVPGITITTPGHGTVTVPNMTGSSTATGDLTSNSLDKSAGVQ